MRTAHSSFTPFNKPLGEKLTEADLQALVERQVTEGYYIEFKSTFPNSEKIGRSLAALANTYGGWYIVGVEDDNKNTATRVCGFRLDEFKNPISKIQEAVKEFVEPKPVIFPQLIELADGRYVLAVHVPGDQDTPFIHRNGVIYRRNHEASDPVPESSRHTVDRLYNATKEREEEFARFCRDERTFAEAEAKNAWLNIYLQPEPFGIVDKSPHVSDYSELSRKVLADFQAETAWLIQGDTPQLTGSIPMQNAYLTADSVVLQQNAWYSARNQLQVQLFFNGRAKFSIPLEYVDLSVNRVYHSALARQVIQKVINDRVNSGELMHFFDLIRLSTASMGLLTYYNNWLGEQPYLSHLKAAITTTNMWRHVPFLDHDLWAQHEQAVGLPAIRQSEVNYPRRPGHGFIMLLNDNEGHDWWFAFVGIMSIMFGLPYEMLTASIFAHTRPKG